MKHIIAISLVATVTACTSFEDKVERAETGCATIGYDYSADGVDATECTETGVRAQQQAESNAATSVAVGILLTVLAVAL